MEQARKFFYVNFNISICNFFIWVSTYPYAFFFGSMFVVEEEGRTQFWEKRKNKKSSKIVGAKNCLVTKHCAGNCWKRQVLADDLVEVEDE